MRPLREQIVMRLTPGLFSAAAMIVLVSCQYNNKPREAAVEETIYPITVTVAGEKLTARAMKWLDKEGDAAWTPIFFNFAPNEPLKEGVGILEFRHRARPMKLIATGQTGSLCGQILPMFRLPSMTLGETIGTSVPPFHEGTDHQGFNPLPDTYLAWSDGLTAAIAHIDPDTLLMTYIMVHKNQKCNFKQYLAWSKLVHAAIVKEHPLNGR